MKYWCLSLFLTGAAQAQTTWYVDVNATPPGLGTQASPYASIQYAHSQPTTVNGDTILVAPGEYDENLVLFKQIVVRATGGPELTTLKPVTTGPVLMLVASISIPDVLKFDGFTITGFMGPANGAAVSSQEGTLLHCIIRGNRGANFYGVDTTWDSSLIDCTVVDNDVGIECSFFIEALWLRNTIVWGNGSNVQSWGQPAVMDVAYSAGGPFPYAFGVGNHVGDPGMWDLASGDYRLRPGSVCIDTGDPTLPLDPDGSRSDIGFYIYDPLYAPVSRYCTGKLNSQGCTPKIAGSGLPSTTSPSPFMITASLLVPGKPSLLLYGYNPNVQPFQGGSLCMGSPLHRVGVQTSAGSGACGGTCAYDFNLRIQSGADPMLSPGAFAYAQWWQRDPNDPAGFGSGLTNALRFGIAP